MMVCSVCVLLLAGLGPRGLEVVAVAGGGRMGGGGAVW